MNLNNIPENVLKYLLDRNLRVNRMQYYLYNVNDIIVLSKYWWIIPMYISTKIPKTTNDTTIDKPTDNTGSDNEKLTIKDVYNVLLQFQQVFMDFAKEQNERWQKQEEFNSWVKDVFKRNNLK